MATTNKYGARRTVVDGITFASAIESRRYVFLKHLVDAGVITGLECHPSYPITHNGTKICKVELDFLYWHNGERIVEDVKGMDNQLSKLKRKLVRAFHGVDVTIVKSPTAPVG